MSIKFMLDIYVIFLSIIILIFIFNFKITPQNPFADKFQCPNNMSEDYMLSCSLELCVIFFHSVKTVPQHVTQTNWNVMFWITVAILLYQNPLKTQESSLEKYMAT